MDGGSHDPNRSFFDSRRRRHIWEYSSSSSNDSVVWNVRYLLVETCTAAVLYPTTAVVLPTTLVEYTCSTTGTYTV